MKCLPHQAEAVAVCPYCGRAVCSSCLDGNPAPARMVCSKACAEALVRNEDAIRLILQRGVQSLRGSAFYCYLCGVLSIAGAVAAHFLLPSPFLVIFCAGCGVALIASGIWYGRAAKKQCLDPASRKQP